MTVATTDTLLEYLADLIEKLERFGATVLPPNDGEEVAWGQDTAGNLVMDIEARLPGAPRSRNVDLSFQERWRAESRDAWFRFEYGYELLSHELDYRRAFHRHDDRFFVTKYQVVTHEHCELTIGYATCDHYFGEPVSGALDAFERLFALWLSGVKPDCSDLTCLGS